MYSGNERPIQGCGQIRGRRVVHGSQGNKCGVESCIFVRVKLLLQEKAAVDKPIKDMEKPI